MQSLWDLPIFEYDLAAYMSLLLALSFFPGASNARLAATASVHGWQGAWPSVVGMTAGVWFLFAFFGGALEYISRTWPVVDTLLKWSSMAYLVWLAWRMAHDQLPAPNPPKARTPLMPGVRRAFIAQMYSPISWSLVAAVVSVYVPSSASWEDALLMLLCFPLGILPGRCFWVWVGLRASHWTDDDTLRRHMCWLLAALMLLSLVPTLDN